MTLPKINEYSDQLIINEEEISSNNGYREYGGLNRNEAETLMVQQAWGEEKYPEINKAITRKDKYVNKQNDIKEKKFALPSLGSESPSNENRSPETISSNKMQSIKGENAMESNQVSKLKGTKQAKTGKKSHKDEANISTNETLGDQEESPREILARLTQRRQSVKQEQKNPAVWKKTGQPDTIRQPLGKHMMASAEGKSGAKQIMENNPEEISQIGDHKRRESRQDEKIGEKRTKHRRQKKQHELNELGNMLSLGVNAQQRTRGSAPMQQPLFGESEEDSVWQNGFIPNVAPPSNYETGKKAKPKSIADEKSINNSKTDLDESGYSLPLVNNDGKRSKQINDAAAKLKGYTGQSKKETVKHPEETFNLPNMGTHWTCIGEEEESLGRKSSCSSPVLPFHVKPTSSSKTTTNQMIETDKRILQKSKQRKNSLTQNKDSCHNVTRKISSLPSHCSYVKVDRRSVFQMADAELAIKRRVTQSEVMALSMFRFQSSFTFSFFSLPDQYKKHNESIIENTKYIGKRGANRPRKIQRPNKTLVDTK